LGRKSGPELLWFNRANEFVINVCTYPLPVSRKVMHPNLSQGNEITEKAIHNVDVPVVRHIREPDACKPATKEQDRGPMINPYRFRIN
jgi:hypothetical protein